MLFVTRFYVWLLVRVLRVTCDCDFMGTYGPFRTEAPLLFMTVLADVESGNMEVDKIVYATSVY